MSAIGENVCVHHGYFEEEGDCPKCVASYVDDMYEATGVIEVDEPRDVPDDGPFVMSRYLNQDSLHKAMNDRIAVLMAEIARLVSSGRLEIGRRVIANLGHDEKIARYEKALSEIAGYVGDHAQDIAKEALKAGKSE